MHRLEQHDAAANERATGSASSGSAPLLLVDNEAYSRGRLSRMLMAADFAVTSVSSMHAAVAAATRTTFSHAVIELRLHDGHGVALIARLRALHAPMRIVVITGFNPDSPDGKALSQSHAPVSVAGPSAWAGSGGRVRMDATGERRSPPFRQRFRELRACRPDPNGESRFNSFVSVIVALRAGASDYLPKPIDEAELVDALLDRARTLPTVPEMPLGVDRICWEHTMRVFEQCGRNVRETARRLGMHRRSLQRILNKRAPQPRRIGG